MKSKRVILDTNVWISFLITKDYSFIDKYVENKKVSLVFSDELIHEFLTVATRPKLQKYFTKKDIELLLQTFDNLGVLIKVTSRIELCRDNKDNFLLNLAVDSKANYLVTGDKDLLEIKNIGKTKIIPIGELKERL